MRVRGSHIQVFMTTGVLLRRLHGDPELTGITHVLVDEARAQHGAWPVARSIPCMACCPLGPTPPRLEYRQVHERNLDSDFLLIILRDLLPKRPHLRLVPAPLLVTAGSTAPLAH